MSILQQIKFPLRITDIRQVADYYQVITDVSCINIYNPVQWIPDQQRCTGCNIIGITVKEQQVLSFQLETDAEIRVSLLDSDFTGPEACSMTFADGTCIVID